jgi:hypothetical protein
VVIGALKLLEATEGPVLVDFPEDVPNSDTRSNHLVCPVSFFTLSVEMSHIDRMMEEFRSEAANMNGWYEIALQKRGRTTAGITGLTPEEIVAFYASFLGGALDASPLDDVPVANALRMAAEDLKAVYFEGLAAQPGGPYDSTVMADWFWGETVAARVINVIRETCLGLPDNDFQLLGKLLLVPRSQLHWFRKSELM